MAPEPVSHGHRSTTVKMNFNMLNLGFDMFDKILIHFYQSDLSFLSRLDFPHAPPPYPVPGHYIFGCWLPVVCNKIVNLEDCDDKIYLGACLWQVHH